MNAPPANTLSAIVAESSQEFGHWMTRTLQGKGLHVRLTDSAAEALRWFGESAPDFLFVNAFLHDMMGFEVIERIRAQAPDSEAKILLIGAIYRSYRYHAMPKDLYGADAYVEEGVTETELFTLMETLLPGMGKTASPRPPEARKAAPARREAPAFGGAAIEHEEDVFKRARTLAEIIISDIYIYKPIRARRSILKGRFEEAFAEELQIGRAYFDKRMPAHALGGRDVFREALDDFLTVKRREYEAKEAKAV
jgi:DNA-binding response OmpR family regulator